MRRIHANLKPPIVLLAILGIAASPASARVTGVDVARREVVLDGTPFGLAGPYEKIVGTIRYAIDPANPRNQTVVDLDRAPLDAEGHVEFSADLYVLKPLDPVKGNGSMLIEIPNRGGKGMLSLLDQGAGSLDPATPEEFGDGFLLRHGFTLAWIGWQFDVRDEPGRMRLNAPTAKGVKGLVRADFVVPEKSTEQPVGHSIAGNIGGTEYAPADPGSRKNTLTVRDHPLDEREVIPRDQWTLTDETIEYPAGFEPGRIYELIYEAEDPALVGLGLVAVRDLASWAKNDPEALAPAERVIAFGISQSGRFLRHYLYQGFNADEQGRRALDGVMAHVAGAGRGSFNHRFAQPSRDGQPLEALFYPTDLYPFTDVPVEDPLTGRKEGLLDRTEAAGVTPRIFYTNTSYEYWGRAGSLIHTTPDGKADVDPPPSTRIYHLAGLQHFPRPGPPQRMQLPAIRGRYLMNPNPSAPTLRALLVAMQDWIARGVDPPPSRFPRIEDATLVPLDTVREKFPRIPGVDLPTDVHLAYRVDYGPDFATKGIITQHPPRVGAPFVSLVPGVDANGNDVGGIRIPQLEVPVATYTSWNLRDPSIGAPWSRVSFLGSYFAFAPTREAREAAGDPRPSIADRYDSFAKYFGQYTQAARNLVAQRFLLREDLDLALARGVDEWADAHEAFEPAVPTNASQ